MTDAIVDKYLGIPYVHLGRDLKTGIDCWGLVVNIFKDLGIELWELEKQDFGPEWYKENGQDFFLENYHRQWEEISKPRRYACALFKVRGYLINHIGVFLNDTQFIHCSRKTGTIVSRITDQPWIGRLHGIYKLKDLNL